MGAVHRDFLGFRSYQSQLLNAVQRLGSSGRHPEAHASRDMHDLMEKINNTVASLDPHCAVHCCRYVRKHVAKTVPMRRVPEIRFMLDRTMEQLERVCPTLNSSLPIQDAV